MLPLNRSAAGTAVDLGSNHNSSSTTVAAPAVPAWILRRQLWCCWRQVQYDQLVQHGQCFCTCDNASYTQAICASGDPASIWRWLQLASRVSQPQLLAHFMQHVIAQRLVPNSADDVAGLHPTDLAELLLACMKENAQVRYRCLSCADRHCTEVWLCSHCSFSPHIRL